MEWSVASPQQQLDIRVHAILLSRVQFGKRFYVMAARRLFDSCSLAPVHRVN